MPPYPRQLRALLSLTGLFLTCFALAHSARAWPTPPTVTIARPVAGGGVQGGVVAVYATLSSNTGVSDVQFFVDGVSIGIDTTPPFLVGWNTTTAANGSHTLTAVAHDGVGGSVTSAPVVVSSVTPAFTNEVVVPDIAAAVTIAFLPDGRMLVGELTLKIWVVQPGANTPNATPFLSLDASNLSGERGLFDILIDPNFATNGWYYVFYTRVNAGEAKGHNRVSRFTASGNTTVAGSEFLLWQDGQEANNEHQGGSLSLGNDGKLYISVGDAFSADDSQWLGSDRGKVLRLNLDGTLPAGNPFADGGGPNKDEIWVRGLRNPFRGSIDPVTGRFYLGDVGGNDPSTAFEEVNLIVSGANYGWPLCEGPCTQPGVTGPFFSYPHNGRDASITGGLVYRGSQFPPEYYNSYFYGDYVQNTIKRLVLDSSGNLLGAVNFLPPDGTPDTPLGDIAKFVVGPDGALYYVDVGFNSQHTPNDAAIRRVRWTAANQPPVAVVSATPQTGIPPLSVTFSSAGTYDPEGAPLTYSWTFGDGGTSNQPNPSHTYPSSGSYTARLSVSDGASSTLSSDLVISVGSPPSVSILTPTDGLTFQGGDVIAYSGDGTDPEDGVLPASAFSWLILFHHDSHVHPGGGPFTGTKSGTLVIPTSGHDFSGTTSYEIILTVTDSTGLSASQSVFVYPQKVNLSISTVPAGLSVDIDGVRRVTPVVKDTVINFQHVLGAPDQSLANFDYTFANWSDGGAASHTVTMPPGGASYVATFQATQPTGLVAAYGFDEPSGGGVNDQSTSGNNGALVGGVTRTPSGRFGGALAFDGASGRVSVPDAPSLDLATGMTLEAWIYPTQSGASARDVIRKESGSYYLEQSDAAADQPGTGGDFAPVLLGPGSLPLGAWTHLAGTYDGAVLRLYVNGVEVASRGQTGLLSVSSQPLSIGGDGVFGQYFAGLIDEVRVYSRALSLAEIQSDMATAVDPAHQDSDGDGVADPLDNCVFVANPTQSNSDAFPAGDACQCGDVDVNGAADAADVAALRDALLVGPPPGLGAAGANRCAVIAPAASCDVVDLTVLRRALAAQPPGVAQVCPAQFAP